MGADERDEWLAYYALTCSRCGNLRSECSDETRDWHPQESVCWATATREWGERRLREEHKGFDLTARDHRGELVMGPLDGVHVWVSDVDFQGMREEQDLLADADLVQIGQVVGEVQHAPDVTPDEGTEPVL